MDVALDTDPGGDDGIALMWLASLVHQGRARLRAVTAAAGNVSAQRALSNARGILVLCGLTDVPVGQGIHVARGRPEATAHGSDGLGGLAQTLPSAADTGHPAPASRDLMAALLGRRTGAISLLATAPLTNLAAVEQQSAGALSRAQDLIIVGGSFAQAAPPSAGEFNFSFDPEAALRVLEARPGSRLITLDTSRRLRLERRQWNEIVCGYEELSAALFFRRLCQFMAGRYRRLHDTAGEPGFPVHDAAAVAWLAYPELFSGRTRRLEAGALVANHRNPAAAATVTVEVAGDVSEAALLRVMAADLRLLFAALAGRAG